MAVRKNNHVMKDFVTRKRTSIGESVRSKPKNKHQKRTWKKYRGQGKNR